MSTQHRRRYITIYVPVSRDGLRCIVSPEGVISAYSDVKTAEKVATTFGYMVVTWKFFKAKLLANLTHKAGPQMRIHHVESRTFLAGLDAPEEQLITLNMFTPSDYLERGGEIAEFMKTAKVWEEKK